MKKILFYLDGWFLHFGIANKLQNEFELFGIVDVAPKTEKFYRTQKIVDFKKLFYYNDMEEKTDLVEFEKKYNVPFTQILYGERHFSKFSPNEIHEILAKESKFFEDVIDNVMPDFFLSYMPITHQNVLCEKICKAKGIDCHILSTMKLGNRMMISKEAHTFDTFNSNTFAKLETNPYNSIKNFKKLNFEDQKFFRFKSLYNFLKDYTPTNRIEDKGKTRIGIIKQRIDRKIKRKNITPFLESLPKQLPNKFVYFPLHYEPEKALLVDAPFYTEQLNVIANIAKSLPIRYQLCVKEHPMMETIGWRTKEYYQKIIDMPNVLLIHTNLNPQDIIQKTDLVISISGSACMEASFEHTPSISLSKKIGLSRFVENIQELPKIIKEELSHKITDEEIDILSSNILENSFEFSHHQLCANFAYEFGMKGPSMNQLLNEEKIINFLSIYDDDFTILEKEHLRKINLET